MFFFFIGIYIYYKRNDWYLFFFPMLVLYGICFLLSYISEICSFSFALVVIFYIAYMLLNKKAKMLRIRIKNEEEEIRQSYKLNKDNGVTKLKNYVLPNGKKVDFIDFDLQEVWLLRPYTDNVSKKYKKTIQKYENELEKIYGGKWKCNIEIK